MLISAHKRRNMRDALLSLVRVPQPRSITLPFVLGLPQRLASQGALVASQHFSVASSAYEHCTQPSSSTRRASANAKVERFVQPPPDCESLSHPYTLLYPTTELVHRIKVLREKLASYTLLTYTSRERSGPIGAAHDSVPWSKS